MRWICPRCHRAVNIAFLECPYCPPPVSQPESPERSTANKTAAVPPPLPTTASAVAAVSASRRSPASPPPTPARLASPTEEPESVLYRGVRLGVGLMLALVTILLLLVLLLLWLSTKPGWQEWVEQLGV